MTVVSREARRLFVPTVVQTSAMDCGPASLKALLGGFAADLDYGRLREACQTDIDGTSIDMIEQLTVKLGFEAAQYIVPVDHLMMGETDVLPCLCVTRLPSGLTHFVVVWRTHGRFVQVMDPGIGRTWRTRRSFLRDVFVHRFAVPADVARSWLTIDGFQLPLRRRMADVGWNERAIDEALARAQEDTQAWLPVAALDAATRLTARLVDVKAVTRGPAAAQLVARLAADAARGTPAEATLAIPAQYWSVALVRGEPALVGAVLLHVAGPSEPPGDEETDEEAGPEERAAAATHEDGAHQAAAPLAVDADAEPEADASAAAATPEVAADEDAAPRAFDADAEPGAAADDPAEAATIAATSTAQASPADDFASRGGSTPVRTLLKAAFAESGLVLPVVTLALLIAGAVVAIEALLLGGLAGGARTDWASVMLVVVFLLVSTLLNVSTASVLLRIGRWLDIHLRIRLMEKLPRLGNYYFHSRLPSDLAHRAHELRTLRQLPRIAANALLVLSEVVLTMAGIAWLFPAGALPVLLATIALLGLPLILTPLLHEQERRIQAHAGALMRFYLDALLGLTPIRAHRAEQAVRAEHEALLTHWAGATNESFWTHIGGFGLGMLAGTLFALWTIGRHLDAGSDGTTLLVVYWSLKLPVLAQQLAMVVKAVPALHNTLLRLFEVLDASEEAGTGAHGDDAAALAATGGVHVEMRGVGVVAAGQQILVDVDLELRPGEHVAIVGPSGSGKSSLVGLLLGWHQPAAGTITVDGAPLQADVLQRLRCATAWVDPGIQIWNRSLTRNLRYGNEGVDDAAVAAAIAAADLEGVVSRLPLGADTPLGEGGGLVSGGEGQRVRLARALLKSDARLAILDEPFRGLDGDKRRELLAAARVRWQATTMVYVSHDIDTALGFSRVLVIEGGRIVEDGAPAELLVAPGSRLAALHAAQEALHREVWGDPTWRRWRMERGVLRVPGEEGG